MIFLLRFVKWVYKGITISAAPPLIGQERSKNMQTPPDYIKKRVDRYKKGVNTSVFASKYNLGIKDLRCETAAVHIATSSKRKSV